MPTFKTCNNACIASTLCCTNPDCAATPTTPICANGTCVACKALGATGCTAGGCCDSTNTCVSDTCVETTCQPDGHACTGPSECCSRLCLGGRCGCAPTGNNCRYDRDCCVGMVGGMPAGTRCNAVDQFHVGICVICTGGGQFSSCSTNADCCGGLVCNIISGSVCDTPGIALDGQACSTPAICLSGSCAGVCQPQCLDLGGTCASDSDCCSRKCLGTKCVYAGCGATGSPCTTAGNCCSDVCNANNTCV
jgi:hypothetical protein